MGESISKRQKYRFRDRINLRVSTPNPSADGLKSANAPTAPNPPPVGGQALNGTWS